MGRLSSPAALGCAVAPPAVLRTAGQIINNLCKNPAPTRSKNAVLRAAPVSELFCLVTRGMQHSAAGVGTARHLVSVWIQDGFTADRNTERSPNTITDRPTPQVAEANSRGSRPRRPADGCEVRRLRSCPTPFARTVAHLFATCTRIACRTENVPPALLKTTLDHGCATFGGPDVPSIWMAASGAAGVGGP